jgi:hypothetical protein
LKLLGLNILFHIEAAYSWANVHHDTYSFLKMAVAFEAWYNWQAQCIQSIGLPPLANYYIQSNTASKYKLK